MKPSTPSSRRSTPFTLLLPSQKIKIRFKYDLNWGFSKNDWPSLKAQISDTSYNFIKKYTEIIERDHTFRFICNKVIERIFSAIGFLVLFISIFFTILKMNFAFLSLTLVFGTTFYFSWKKAFKLSSLRKSYNYRLDELDINYFDAIVFNDFGDYSWWIYGLFGFLKPDISIRIEARVKPL